MKSLTIFLMLLDGTAHFDGPGKSKLKCRHCATDNHGSVAGLLAEMRTRRKSERLPWESKGVRGAAALRVRRMSWLPARTRSALMRHIGSTPYLENPEEVRWIYLVSSKGEPNFAYHRAARTHPMDGRGLGDLRAEAARCASGQAAGAEPILYESREIRDEQAERIRKAENLPEDDKTMLLAHVARTPYMEVTKRGPVDYSKARRL